MTMSAFPLQFSFQHYPNPRSAGPHFFSYEGSAPASLRIPHARPTTDLMPH